MGMLEWEWMGQKQRNMGMDGSELNRFVTGNENGKVKNRK
jgi:hypothetical protein